MIKPKVILTVGMSNSGKTTWANRFINENPHFVDLNRDDMRVSLYCGGDIDKYSSYNFLSSREREISDIITMRAENAVSSGKGIIISDTNLNPEIRNKWKVFADKHNMPYEEKPFWEDLHICLIRNQRRRVTLPEKALKSQYKRMRQYMDMPYYTPDESLPKAILVDVDGTIAHMGKRRGPFEYSKVNLDTPDDIVIGMINEYAGSTMDIVIMSGRDDSCRRDTEQWCHDNHVFPTEIHMRCTGDKRPDVQVKEDLFWPLTERYNIVAAFDDRNQVVDLWRSIGLKCMQVADGEF